MRINHVGVNISVPYYQTKSPPLLYSKFLLGLLLSWIGASNQPFSLRFLQIRWLSSKKSPATPNSNLTRYGNWYIPGEDHYGRIFFWVPNNPSLPKSSKYLVRRCFDPFKAFRLRRVQILHEKGIWGVTRVTFRLFQLLPQPPYTPKV